MMIYDVCINVYPVYDTVCYETLFLLGGWVESNIHICVLNTWYVNLLVEVAT